MDTALHQTPEKDRIPASRKMAFGFGALTQCLGSWSIGNLVNYVLNIGLGVSPVLVGLVQSLPRLWDAFSDPLMGHISDNTRSRFGRRRPYMLIGAVLSGLTFAILWCLPSDWSELSYFLYFLCISLLFYTALTVFMVPWGALGLEMTQDYHERTRIQAVSLLFANIGALIMPWLFALTQLSVFKNQLQGAKAVGIGVGILLTLSGLIPALFCKEKHYQEAAQDSKLSLRAGLKETCSNRVFIRLTLAVLFAATGVFTINTLSPYIIIYYVMGGNVKEAAVYTGWNGTAWMAASILAVAPVSWIVTRIGKKAAFLVFLGCTVLGHLSKIWCYNPNHPLLVIIPPILIAAGFIAIWMVGSSMIADICDLDELKTGARREGSYQAIYGWILKMGQSLAFLLGGILLTATGFDKSLGGSQGADTILYMRILEAGLPAVTAILAIWILWRYPLNESQVRKIREQLQDRQKTTP
ncbi:MAG: MFS transporter [Kiritimatiellales bacterium]